MSLYDPREHAKYRRHSGREQREKNQRHGRKTTGAIICLTCRTMRERQSRREAVYDLWCPTCAKITGHITAAGWRSLSRIFPKGSYRESGRGAWLPRPPNRPRDPGA